MKIKLLIIIFLSLSFFKLSAQYTMIEGIYKGENLYIFNPYIESKKRFCIDYIYVNEKKIDIQANSSSVEINLNKLSLKQYEEVAITIKHLRNCELNILNIDAINPESTFEIQKIRVTKDSILTWATIDESYKLNFIIEQFRWNYWIEIANLQGIGTPVLHKYSAKVNLHSGENIFRIKQLDNGSDYKYSDTVKIVSDLPEVKFIHKKNRKIRKVIIFTELTSFEIYDYYANLLLTGKGKRIDISELPKGKYFLNYDNKTETFIKK